MHTLGELAMGNRAKQTLLPTLAVIILCAGLAQPARSDEIASTNGGKKNWSELIGQAEKAFRPISQEQIGLARKELQVALDALEERLNQAGPEADGWRKYLLMDELTEEITKESPDLDKLGSVYQRLAAGHEGLGLIWFSRLRQAIEQYIVVRRAAENPILQDEYKSLLGSLPQALTQYEQSQDPAAASQVERFLRWLELAGLVEDLTRAVRSHFSQPNVVLQVSAAWLESAGQQDVDRQEPVRELILGTDVRGTGHITGVRRFQLVPSPNQALLLLLVEGQIESDTIGYNGPARIYSHSVTPFVARKCVTLSPQGIAIEPTRCKAQTTTHIKDVDVTCRSRCVEQIAWRRTWKQKPAAEAEAARRAERRVSRRVDEEADSRFQQAQENYLQKIRQPLLDRDLFPQPTVLQTTAEALSMQLTQKGHAGLAAPIACPVITENGAIVLQVHQSSINNFTQGLFADMILKEQRLQEALQNLWGELPEEFASETGEEPWTVRFVSERPLAVHFAANCVSIEFRGETYWKGERGYPGMDVKTTYRIETQADQPLRLVRVGELSVFPPGFDPDKDRLSVRQQTLRRLLERRFGKIFRETVELKPVELKGEWQNGGPLVVKHLSAQDGWLSLLLDKPSN